MSNGWKLTLIIGTIIVVAFMFINAFVLGNAGSFIQSARETGGNLANPSPYLYWNLRLISMLVGAGFGGIIALFLKEHW